MKSVPEAVSSTGSIIDRIQAEKKALKVKDLAERLNVSTRTVYTWTENRKAPLPFIRLGSAIRFDPQDTADWLRDRSTATLSC